jgi:hypothetical protein
MKLYPKHLKTEVTPEGVIFENEFLGFLRSNGYSVNGTHSTNVVPSSNGDHAYLVQKIATMKLPSNHPDLDVVAHEYELICCTCDDWRYRKSPDVSEPQIHPPDSKVCKHAKSEFKTIRAKADESQETLP